MTDHPTTQMQSLRRVFAPDAPQLRYWRAGPKLADAFAQIEMDKPAPGEGEMRMKLLVLRAICETQTALLPTAEHNAWHDRMADTQESLTIQKLGGDYILSTAHNGHDLPGCSPVTIGHVIGPAPRPAP